MLELVMRRWRGKRLSGRRAHHRSRWLYNHRRNRRSNLDAFQWATGRGSGRRSILAIPKSHPPVQPRLRGGASVRLWSLIVVV